MALLSNSTPKRSRLRLLSIDPRGTMGSGKETALGSGGDEPLIIKIPSTQSVPAMRIQLQAAGVAAADLFQVDQAGNLIQSGVVSAKQCVVQVAITSAQIKTLNTAPLSLVAAPGAGVALVADAMLFQYKYGTTQYTSGGAVNPVYHSATTNLLGGSVAAATIQAAASAVVSLGGPAAALTAPANTGIDLYAATGNFATGDGTAIAVLWYTAYTLG